MDRLKTNTNTHNSHTIPHFPWHPSCRRIHKLRYIEEDKRNNSFIGRCGIARKFLCNNCTCETSVFYELENSPRDAKGSAIEGTDPYVAITFERCRRLLHHANASLSFFLSCSTLCLVHSRAHTWGQSGDRYEELAHTAAVRNRRFRECVQGVRYAL